MWQLDFQKNVSVLFETGHIKGMPLKLSHPHDFYLLTDLKEPSFVNVVLMKVHLRDVTFILLV